MKSADLSWSHAMTEVNKAAEHPMAKLGLQIFQALLIAAAIGSYTSISGSLESIKTSLGSIQTESALLKQRMEAQERATATQGVQMQAMSTDLQRHGYDIDSLKALPPRKEITSRDKQYH